MGYLTKRILFLKNEFETGKVILYKGFSESEEGKSLIEDLLKVTYLPNGDVDLSTCSSHVRSFARIIYSAKHSKEYEKGNDQNSKHADHAEYDPSLSKLMKEYFSLLDNFFEECAGFKASKFHEDDFPGMFDTHRKEFISRSEKIRNTYEQYIPKITAFFGKNHTQLYRSGRNLPGVKCVIGGTSRFPVAAFDGIRKFALYADTIFIPDPVLPWLEVDRIEERFRTIRVMEEAFTLLKLKPLVDADLADPAVVVFPSWEKSLEASDEVTQDSISALWLNFFSVYLGGLFEDESEVFDFAGKRKTELFKLVKEKDLFIPPGDRKGNSIEESLGYYRKYIAETRSKEYNEVIDKAPDEILLINGIMERLIPQFHIRDNADALESQPLFWLNVHSHYFNLCSRATGSRLEESGFLQQKTVQILQALQKPSLTWLGNVPLRDLVHMRMENLNVEFRTRLRAYTDELGNSTYEDLNKVAANVGSGLADLIDEHEKTAKEIAEKYYKKHLETLGLSILTAGAILIPWLDPFFAASGVIPTAAKLIADLHNEKSANDQLSHSLTGILSEASKNT
jgi:hypothetical protein